MLFKNDIDQIVKFSWGGSVIEINDFKVTALVVSPAISYREYPDIKEPPELTIILKFNPDHPMMKIFDDVPTIQDGV